jgi:hypothetical protein
MTDQVDGRTEEGFVSRKHTGCDERGIEWCSAWFIGDSSLRIWLVIWGLGREGVKDDGCCVLDLLG